MNKTTLKKQAMMGVGVAIGAILFNRFGRQHLVNAIGGA